MSWPRNLFHGIPSFFYRERIKVRPERCVRFHFPDSGCRISHIVS